MAADPPVCVCHGVPQYWHKKKDMAAGGLWRCREKRKPLDAARWQDYSHGRMPAKVRLRHEYAKSMSQRRVAHAKKPRPSNPRMAAFLAVTRRS